LAAIDRLPEARNQTRIQWSKSMVKSSVGNGAAQRVQPNDAGRDPL
jgi:hypothetical protein